MYIPLHPWNLEQPELNNVMNKDLFRAVRSEQHIKQRKKCTGIRTWLNGNAVFYETFICFYISEAKPRCFSLSNI